LVSERSLERYCSRAKTGERVTAVAFAVVVILVFAYLGADAWDNASRLLGILSNQIFNDRMLAEQLFNDTTIPKGNWLLFLFYPIIGVLWLYYLARGREGRRGFIAGIVVGVVVELSEKSLISKSDAELISIRALSWAKYY
jgi:Na+/proline symporter